MKQLITIAAVLLVGCGPSKAPKISLFEAAVNGDLKAIRQHISVGTDISENTTERTETPLLGAILLGEGWYNTGPHKINVLQFANFQWGGCECKRLIWQYTLARGSGD